MSIKFSDLIPSIGPVGNVLAGATLLGEALAESTRPDGQSPSAGGYYQISEKGQTLPGLWGMKYPYVNGAMMDIYNAGYWKINSANQADDVHQLHLQEFNVRGSAGTQMMNKLIGKLTTGQSVNEATFYENLYMGEPTNVYYNLPRLLPSGGYLHAPLTNTWKGNDLGGVLASLGKTLMRGGKDGGGKVAKAARVAGGAMSAVGSLAQGGRAMGLMGSMVAGTMNEEYAKDELKAYDETDPYTLTLNFQLYNTPRDGVNGGHVGLHVDFVHLFYFQNLKTRTGPFTMLPPKLYKITSTPKNSAPIMPVCYVSNYEIKSLGKTHRIKDRLIPEAYDLTIKFVSLAPSSANQFVQTLNDQ